MSKEEFLRGEVPLFFSGNNVPRIKVYESEYDKNKVFSNLAMSFKKPSINSSSFIDYFNYVDSFSKARTQLEQILNNDTFSTPKPTSLIKFLIKLVNNKNARVLDFFAGSYVIIVSVVKSLIKSRVLVLLQNIKTLKNSNLCVV
ncbi:DNA methyltransferase [Mycoplasmopsis pullorum]|uniref:DNA methyltransferase n=1 Tax=Mycoplasmopsis pullorum TaxID=48003 RepID=UPI0015D64000|nr:DNA methyltransferase [Mycoplasmopsis pullorum]